MFLDNLQVMELLKKSLLLK